MNPELLKYIDVPTLKSPDDHTWQGYTICPICGREFDSNDEGNAVWKLTQHLVKDHSCTREYLYKIYQIDNTSNIHRCIVCGTEYEASPRTVARFKIDPEYCVACCRSCSRSAYYLWWPSSFEESEVQAKCNENSHSEIANAKRAATNMQKYGVECNLTLPEVKASAWTKEVRAKRDATKLDWYGAVNTFADKAIHDRAIENSMHNRKLTTLEVDVRDALEAAGIFVDHNVRIDKTKHVYADFLVRDTNILIEVNPWKTHSSHAFKGNKDNILNKNVHIERSMLAIKNGYRIVHKWDWVSENELVKIVQDMIDNGTDYPITHRPYRHWYCPPDGKHIIDPNASLQPTPKNMYVAIWDSGQDI